MIDEQNRKTSQTARTKEVLNLACKSSILRPRDFKRKAYHQTISGDSISKANWKVGRGMYEAQGAELSEHQTVVQAALRVPHGSSVLFQLCVFHDLTTQSPFEILMAIDGKARTPKEDIIPLRIVRFSGKALTAGVETHSIDGVNVKG